MLGADEQGSEFHEVLRDADDLDGLPVVVADLHSALPAILAGYLAARPVGAQAGSRPKIAYVMLDGGALPAWFSRTAAALTQAGWLAGTVTVGQAFGGDVETVSVHSGLLAARHVLGAELAVVAQGPGNLGTGTRWGFSGVGAGEAINAVAVLGGRPVGSLRISEADSRARHHGVSHHSLTSYGRVALARADIVVPELPGDFGAQVLAAAQPLASRHNLVRVGVAGLAEVLRDCPVQLSTMGRGLDQDLAYFLAAAAAGRHAASLAATAIVGDTRSTMTWSDPACASSYATGPDGSCCSGRSLRPALTRTGGSCPAAGSSRARATSRPLFGSSAKRQAWRSPRLR